MIARSAGDSQNPTHRWLTSLIWSAIALSVGVAFAFYLFSAEMLLDRWSWWDKVRGDNPTGLIGYLYLAQDQWRWPVTLTTLFNPPGGVNIIYTDPVPVAALLGKIIFKISGILQIYMGSWILLAYGLQSLIGWLISRQIGLRPFAAVLAGLLILFMPSFIARVGHIGLVAHWVLLAAILFYLRAVSVASRKEMYAGAVAIGGILSVNPYLLAMAASMFLAGVLEAARRKRVGWREAALLVVVMLATALILALVFGIVGQGGGLPAMGGFGYYSMNVLSPLTPQLSAMPGWSGYLLDSTGGQYEGFNYLGGGVLLLLIGVLVLRFRLVVAIAADNRFLVVALIILTVYAVSSRVYVGPWFLGGLEYQDLPGLSTLTSVFRSSGRFFWPVGYCIIVGILAVLIRSTSRRNVAMLLLAAVTVQWIDINPLVATTRANSQPLPALIDLDAFTRVAGTHSEFTLYPSFHCAPVDDHNRILQIQLVAARAGIPANGAYVNRTSLDCREAQKRFFNRIDGASVSKNPLVIVMKETVAPQLLSTEAAAGFACRETPGAFVCSKATDDPAFVALGPEIKVSPLPLGIKLSVSEGGNGVLFLGQGWSPGDHQSRWADGPNTTFNGRLDKPVCDMLVVRALITPFAYDKYIVRPPTLSLNGMTATPVEVLERGEQVIQHRISLGGRCIQDINLKLQFGRLKSPADLGMNSDVRKLTWLFRWYSFSGE